MANPKLKIVQIGNSRGVRIPAEVLKRFQFGDAVEMVLQPDGILLKRAGPATVRLTWEETAKQMATAPEDWKEWDSLAADGTDGLEWAPAPARVRKVAEPTRRGYASRRGSRKK